MDPTTSQYESKDKGGDELVAQGAHVLPRVEEYQLYGSAVARVFGQLEVNRTKTVGVRRTVKGKRNQASLDRARALVDEGTYSVDIDVTSGGESEWSESE